MVICIHPQWFSLQSTQKPSIQWLWFLKADQSTQLESYSYRELLLAFKKTLFASQLADNSYIFWKSITLLLPPASQAHTFLVLSAIWGHLKINLTLDCCHHIDTIFSLSPAQELNTTDCFDVSGLKSFSYPNLMFILVLWHVCTHTHQLVWRDAHFNKVWSQFQQGDVPTPSWLRQGLRQMTQHVHGEPSCWTELPKWDLVLLSREPSPWKSFITVHHSQIIFCLVREEICILGYCGSRSLLSKWKILLFKQEMSASLVAQMVKNLPAIQETRVWSLGQEDLLEKGMATRSRILTRIPWTEQCMG